MAVRDFNPTRQDRVWAADVTRFHTGEGWLHFAGVIDLYSRRVVYDAADPDATSRAYAGFAAAMDVALNLDPWTG